MKKTIYVISLTLVVVISAILFLIFRNLAKSPSHGAEVKNQQATTMQHDENSEKQKRPPVRLRP